MSTPEVTFDRTVPKKLVHKHALDQVFITDHAAVSETSTVLASLLPRAHGFYCEFPVRDRTPDLALLVEVCRQACFVVAHTQFDVPLAGNTQQFLFQELTARLADDVDLGEARPVEAVVRSSVERTWRRGSTASALEWVFTAETSAGAPLAEVTIKMTWIDRTKWREMRGSMRRGRGLPEATVFPDVPKTEVTPEQVGRVNPENVVLRDVVERDGAFHARIIADLRHPVLFDHPIDHIYAMVQLEACRQLALLAVSRRGGGPAAELEMSACTSEFISVAEFDVPTDLTAAVVTDGGGRATGVSIEITQAGRLVSRFDVGVRQA